MMLSLAELNASVEEEEETNDAPSDDQQLVDMNDALVLLGATAHLLNYIGNPTLGTSVSKREKTNMVKLSKKIGEFLAEVSPTYLEED